MENNAEKMTLINGLFTHAEAKEVITKLLEFKIQFHSRDSFSNEIRYGNCKESSLQRQKELVATKEGFLQYLAGLDANATLSIHADIIIEQQPANV